MPEPVIRTAVVPQATPRQVYAVVADFPAYPRLFPEITAARVLESDGGRARVEFRAAFVLPVRYVLDLACDPVAPAIDWTFVEGEVVSDSVGSWRFVAQGPDTRVEYRASLSVNAPLPGFVLRRVLDGLVSASVPAMFASIAREVAARAGAGRADDA